MLDRHGILLVEYLIGGQTTINAKFIGIVRKRIAVDDTYCSYCYNALFFGDNL